jgi:hypothetical protein
MNTNTPGIGDNSGSPDYALQEVERLGKDYELLSTTAMELIAEKELIPLVIEDDETKGKTTSLIKRIRDAAKRADAFREAEKGPHFRRGQGVDQFFFGIVDRLQRRDKKARPGAADTLLERLTAYDNKKLMEEQERRRKAAEEAAALERQQRAEAARLAAEAEERRLAAERARKPETSAAKQAVADQAQAQASAAAIDAQLAANVAEDRYVETLARPADIMRNRGSDGTLSTMAREPYAEITDAALLDKAALWPFIPVAAKETALRQWARTTGHNQQMAGAAIGHRNKSSVR